MLLSELHTHSHTLQHTRGKSRRSRSKKMWLKRTPRDTHLHINRGSPYQKQRGLSSQPTSSGTGRGERGLRKGEGGSENMLHGRKGRAKSFITVITTWAHSLFHSAGVEEKRKEGEERLNLPTEVFTTRWEISCPVSFFKWALITRTHTNTLTENAHITHCRSSLIS